MKPSETGMYDLIITNGFVIPMAGGAETIENGAVAVKDGVIAAVGPAETLANARAKETVDANGGIILPGLVNCHTHLPMTLFRGMADDLPLDVWLNRHMFPAEAREIDPGTVGLATLLACCEMLLGGTTCCCDGYFIEDAAAQAVAESGMRAVLAQGVIDYPAPGVADPAKNVNHAIEFVEKWQGRHPGVAPSIFCHSPYTCSESTLKRAKRAAHDLGVLFQTHVAETRPEREYCLAEHGKTPVGYLASLGVLDENTLCVHCVWTDEEDIAILADTGAAVALCAESNMKLASGVAPAPKMVKAGVRAGLGTDGCASNNDLDMFGEMGSTARLHKAVTGDPTVMDAETVLGLATTGGAGALGLSDTTGALLPGKSADIIVVDTARPHLTPMYSPVSHLVYAARGSDVRDVFIQGRAVVRDGRVLTLDVGAVMAEMKDRAKRVVR